MTGRSRIDYFLRFSLRASTTGEAASLAPIEKQPGMIFMPGCCALLSVRLDLHLGDDSVLDGQNQVAGVYLIALYPQIIDR